MSSDRHLYIPPSTEDYREVSQLRKDHWKNFKASFWIELRWKTSKNRFVKDWALNTSTTDAYICRPPCTPITGDWWELSLIKKDAVRKIQKVILLGEKHQRADLRGMGCLIHRRPNRLRASSVLCSKL